MLAAAPGVAQEPRPLTLDEARALAAEHNPTYQQAQNEVIRARASELESRAAVFLPNLTLNMGSGGSHSRNFTAFDDFGKPVRSDQAVRSSSSNSSQSLSLSMPLFDGGARLRNLGAARAGRDVAIAGVGAAASLMEAELTTRYYAAQRAAELIALEERLLEAAQGRYTSTERLLRTAAGRPVDLLGAEIDVARQRQAVEVARGEARKAMLALVEQMGTGDAEGWELVTELPEIFDPTTLDGDALVARAYEVSPVLRQSAAAARGAEQQRRAAGAARWPTLSLSSSLSRSISSPDYGAFIDPEALNQGFSFSLGMSLPLFSQYQTSQRMTGARVAALNAQEAARRTRLQLNSQVRSALIDLESAHRTVQLADLEVGLARRRLELAGEQFRLGTLGFVNLQGIINDAATAERSALNARYSFATAVATLEQAVGERIGND
jgi:outer membrane protein